MSTKKTTWETEIGGACVTHCVETPINPGETNEDHCIRHLAEVKASMQHFPPKQ